ncbi:hypothetical protein KR038_001629 [Drosophila bunnanda]|nr:hypothetical protein KR038_001629 [Drosophila bunnanda]
MDDKTLQKHYDRIMRELANEKLMTFEEMVNITKIRPEVLKRTISVLARGLCCYQRYKAPLLEVEDFDEDWTVDDMQDILGFEDENLEDVFSNFGDNLYIDDNPNFEKDEDIVSFEDLVKLTGTHPFYLERCLCHLAILGESKD